MQLRMQEVVSIFESKQEQQRHEFLEDFASILKPDRMALRLGFAKHPLYVQAVEEGLAARAKRQLAGLFMYSLDVESQYAFLKRKRKKREQKAARVQRAVEKWRKSKCPAVPFSSDAIEQSALADHLQAFLSAQPSNVVLSVPKSQSVAMQNLQASLVPSAKCAAASQPLQSELDAGPEPFACAGEENLVAAVPPVAPLTFFRVVHLGLRRQKLVAMPAASKRKLSKHDLCVTVHDAQGNASDTPVVAVEASRATAVQSPVAVLPLLSCDVETLRSDMKVWIARRAPRYVVAGVESETLQNVEGALKRLVACRAFPRTDNVLEVVESDGPLLQQLDVLSRCHLVEQVEAPGDASKWRFSVFGAAQLRVANELHLPEPVFQPLADTSLEALEAGTCWQLFAALRDKGFHVRRRPQKKQAVLQLSPHTPDNVNLLWYVSGASLQHARKYMIALLHSETLFRGGVLKAVHHCQPVAYYNQVLQGNHTGSPLLAVRDADQEVPALQLDAEDVHMPLPPRDEFVALQDELPIPVPPKKRAKRCHDRKLEAEAPGPDQPGSPESLVCSAVEEGDSGSVGLASESASSQVMFLSDSDAPTSCNYSVSGNEGEPPGTPVVESVEASLAAGDGAEEQAPPPPANGAQEQVPPPPPPAVHRPIASQDAIAHGSGRQRHSDSFMWGGFRITWSTPAKRGPHGAWQASCPYHKFSAKTGCKKSIGLKEGTDAEKDKCRDLLKLWCLQAPQRNRQRSHNAAQPRQLEILDSAVLEARLELLPPVPDSRTVEDDATLDAREAAAPKAKAKAKGKAKAKAKSKAKAAPKPGAKAASSAPVPEDDALSTDSSKSTQNPRASDPSSSDNGSSESSSSSSSSSSSAS